MPKSDISHNDKIIFSTLKFYYEARLTKKSQNEVLPTMSLLSMAEKIQTSNVTAITKLRG